MDKTSVTVDQYVRFREDGFQIARGVLAADEVRELIGHVDELVSERPDLLRVHMLHRVSELHERYLLHPRIVDVVAGLVGPEVLALQTMLFVKGPGSPGQGYHGGTFELADIDPVSGADDPNESLNDLAQVAAKYPGRERPRCSTQATPSSSAATSSTARTRTGAARASGGRSSATTATPAPTFPGSLTTGRICSPAAP